MISTLTCPITLSAIPPNQPPTRSQLWSRNGAGDVAALMQAVTPALKRTHNVIDNGATKIVIINGNNNIVQFDSQTKRYLDENIADRDVLTKLVSVGRMNGNQRDVGVYDPEEGRVITGYIPAEATSRTLGNLGRSLTIYVEGQGDSRLQIKYRKVSDPNGRILRYIIYDAWFPTNSE